MGKRKFSLVGWYRRFFLSERTATITAVLAMAVMPIVLSLGIRTDSMNLANVYNLLLRLLLVATLTYSIRLHKLLLMQAATVGLLFCMVCTQSQYALGDLVKVDSEVFITMGLQGFIFLAVEQMILFVESLVCFDHFVVHVTRRRGATCLFVNRAAIVFLLALLGVQLAVAPTLRFDRAHILYVWAMHLDELIVFILLMCAELVLLIDSPELTGE
ncbi:MAG: hypothetical protein U0J70_13165 [Atopobiaceae bacterium]|nr:hypothetical protein [Atopobiaceae bacterium]